MREVGVWESVFRKSLLGSCEVPHANALRSHQLSGSIAHSRKRHRQPFAARILTSRSPTSFCPRNRLRSPCAGKPASGSACFAHTYQAQAEIT
jgi:hypothetical protein